MIYEGYRRLPPKAKAQLRGIPFAIIDGLPAATAKHHHLTVVTRNVKDFGVWGTPATNPWQGT